MVHYDPIGHRYIVDGSEWPSVTGCLRIAGHIDGSWHTMQAAKRGSRVHHATMRLEDGALSIDDPAVADIRGELVAYQRFLETYAPEWHERETPAGCHVLRVAGKPDRVFRSLRGLATDCTGIMEIKTGSIASWHQLQTAGYKRLKRASLRFVLYLKPSGRYRLEPNRDLSDDQVFLRALRDTWKLWHIQPLKRQA